MGDQEKRSLAEEIIDTVREPMLVLEEDLCVRSANASFYRHFQVEPGETVGRRVYELGNGQWNIPRLRELLEDVLPQKRATHPADEMALSLCLKSPGTETAGNCSATGEIWDNSTLYRRKT